jgi:small Trp-rich protein
LTAAWNEFPPIDRDVGFTLSCRKGVIMPIIILIIALASLRYFEVGPFANLSWWWIGGLLLVAFIWFEFIERMLGLDKRRANESLEKARKERVKRAFKK